jgi:DNA-binding HxlR family transcriptional regulator
MGAEPRRGRAKRNPSRWLMRESYLKMLAALEERPLRFMEIRQKADYKNKNLVSAFIRESRNAGLIEEKTVDATDRPVAVAWKITKKGKKVLKLIGEIEKLTA